MNPSRSRSWSYKDQGEHPRAKMISMEKKHNFLDGIILEDYPEDFGPPSEMGYCTLDGQPCDEDGNLLPE